MDPAPCMHACLGQHTKSPMLRAYVRTPSSSFRAPLVHASPSWLRLESARDKKQKGRGEEESPSPSRPPPRSRSGTCMGEDVGGRCAAHAASEDPGLQEPVPKDWKEK